MSKIIHHAVVVSCLSLLSLVAACYTDDTPDVQEELDSLVGSDLATNGYVSSSVSLRLEDGRTFRSSAGMAAPEHGQRYDGATTEQVLGSVTKLYTATLVMQLVEQAQLALDDTLDRWLSFPGASQITVRMLLTHTSGLDDYLDHMTLAELGRHWSPPELLQVALDAGPLGTPGMSQGIYSNTNFLVLGMIVEAVTGTSWEHNVAEHIARPLGLHHTYFAGETERAENLAGGWVHTDAGWLDSSTVIDPSVGWAVGGMVSTNAELFQFTQALFDGKLFEERSTLDQMLTFDTPIDPAHLGEEPPSTVGLAITRFSIEGVRLDGHLGHITGYNSAALRDADTHDVIVVSSNDDRAMSGRLALKVAAHFRGR